MNFFQALAIHAACVGIVSAPFVALCFIFAACCSCTTVDHDARLDDDPQAVPVITVEF